MVVMAPSLTYPRDLVTCPRCWGRGYKPESRKPSKRNPHALGFYARTCPRCQGTGAILPKEK